MKCTNCGEINPDDMKFCGNCGTKLPEPMNHCPTCNKDWPLTMKFCGECGFKFGDGSAGGGAGGLSMGDKNVIAGDVVSNVSNVDNSSTVNNTTNTTTIYNSDETKQVKKCHVCGSFVSIVEGFECPECHQFTCSSCIDEETKVCKNCSSKKAEAKAKEEAEFTAYLTKSEEMDLKKAVELFYQDGNYKESYALAYNIWSKHKKLADTEEVFLNIAFNKKEDGLKIIDSMDKDLSLVATSASCLFFLRCEEFDMVERLLKEAKEAADSDDIIYMNLYYIETLYNIAMFRKYGEKNFLKDAEIILQEEFSVEGDKLENSWKILLLNELNKCKGEEAMEFDVEFCKENKLYYNFVNSNIFAFID